MHGIIQHYTAWTTLSAFVLLTLLPMMPITPVFAHDMPNSCSSHSACADIPMGNTLETPDDMAMDDMVMNLPISKTVDSLRTNNRPELLLAYDEGTEKLSCDCGCQSTPDEFPAVFTPHIPSYSKFQSSIIPARLFAQTAQNKTTRNIPPNIPPPRIA